MGLKVLFQGDSITDCGRNRDEKEPNTAGGLGSGYPFSSRRTCLNHTPIGPTSFSIKG